MEYGRFSWNRTKANSFGGCCATITPRIYGAVDGTRTHTPGLENRCSSRLNYYCMAGIEGLEPPIFRLTVWRITIMLYPSIIFSLECSYSVTIRAYNFTFLYFCHELIHASLSSSVSNIEQLIIEMIKIHNIERVLYSTVSTWNIFHFPCCINKLKPIFPCLLYIVWFIVQIHLSLTNPTTILTDWLKSFSFFMKTVYRFFYLTLGTCPHNMLK